LGYKVSANSERLARRHQDVEKRECDLDLDLDFDFDFKAEEKIDEKRMLSCSLFICLLILIGRGRRRHHDIMHAMR
jgi:hypothetical protein